MSFWCLQISQKTRHFLRISALASKKRSNQKRNVRESKENPPISGIKCPYLFDLTPKGRFKINRPLVGDQTLSLEFFEKLDVQNTIFSKMCPIFSTLGPPVDTNPEPDVITHFRFRHAPHHIRPGHAPQQ